MGWNQQKSRPFVVDAQMMNGLVVRLERCKTTTDINNDTLRILKARTLSLTVQVLSSIATTKVMVASNATSE